MTATPDQPATPSEALRQAVALFDPGPLGPDVTEATVQVRNIALMMSRWADELDAAPAAVCCTQRDGYECDVHSPTARVGEREIVQMEDLPDDVQERAVHRAVMGDRDGMMAALQEGVDQVRAARATDPGPAATYALPAEPPVGTILRTRLGFRFTSHAAPWAAELGEFPAAWCMDGKGYGSGIPWHALLAAGRLPTVPPAGTGDDQ